MMTFTAITAAVGLTATTPVTSTTVSTTVFHNCDSISLTTRVTPNTTATVNTYRLFIVGIITGPDLYYELW